MAILELPVNIAFLAMSFVAGFTIANPARTSDGVITFCIYVAVSVIVVVCWRRSLRMFDTNRYLGTAILGSLNILLCVFGLVCAVRLLGSI